MNFDLTRGWGLFVAGAAVLAIILVYVTAGEKLYRAWERLRPEPDPEPLPGDLKSPEPYVVLGHPGGQQSTTPLSELAEGEKSQLTRLAPRYLIENKDPTVGVREVTTGIRTRGGRSHQFEQFFADLLGPGEQVTVDGVEIPPEFFEGVHTGGEPFAAFLYWAHFRRQDEPWEVTYDPQTRRNIYRQVAAEHPGLDARVRKTSERDYVLDIENTGDTTIEQVEVEVPPGVGNWSLLTEALASYPIRALEPGDRESMPLVVTMGPHTSVEVTLRGRASGVPYERKRTVSIIG